MAWNPNQQNPQSGGSFNNFADFMPGLSSILGGLFGGDQHKDFKKMFKQAQGYQQPFYDAGRNALNPYQDSLDKMSNPEEFLKSIMGGYNESPFAKFQKDQGVRSATNQASASGLSGSTPLAHEISDYSQDVSSKDMQQYLNNILGIGKDYRSGLGDLISGGQNSANSLSNLFTQNYGNSLGGKNSFSDISGGIMQLLPLLMGLL